MEFIEPKKPSKYNKNLDNLSLVLGLVLGVVAFVLMSFMDYYNSSHISADLFHKLFIELGIEQEVVIDETKAEPMSIVINQVKKEKSKQEILEIFESDERPNILSDLIEEEIGFGTQDNDYKLVIIPELDGGVYNSPQIIRLSTNFVDKENNLVNPSVYHDDVLLYYNNLDAEPDYFLPYEDGFMVKESSNNVIFYAVHTGGVYTGGEVYTINDNSNPTIEKAVYNKDKKSLILYFDEIMNKEVSYNGEILSQILSFSNDSTLEPYTVATWIDSSQGFSALEIAMGAFAGSEEVSYIGDGPFSPLTDLFDNEVIQQEMIHIDVESTYIPAVKIKYSEVSDKLPLYLNFETYFTNTKGESVTSNTYSSDIKVMRKVMPVNEYNEDTKYDTYDNWVFDDSLLMYYAVDLRTGIRSEINTKLYYTDDINSEMSIEAILKEFTSMTEANRNANQFIASDNNMLYIDMLWSHEKYIIHTLEKSNEIINSNDGILQNLDKSSRDNVLDKWYEFKYSIENILDEIDSKVEHEEGVQSDISDYFEMMYERSMDMLDDNSELLESVINLTLTKYDIDYVFEAMKEFEISMRNIKVGVEVTTDVMDSQVLEDTSDDIRDAMDALTSSMNDSIVALINLTEKEQEDTSIYLEKILEGIKGTVSLVESKIDSENESLLNDFKYLRDDVDKFTQDIQKMINEKENLEEQEEPLEEVELEISEKDGIDLTSGEVAVSNS